MSIQELTNRTKRRSFLSEKFGGLYDKLTGNSLELLGSLKGEVVLRKMLVEDEDDAKNMIRNSLLEFGGIGVDSLFFDEDLEYFYESYTKKDSRVIVAVKRGQIIGTAALKPLVCADGHLVDGMVELNHFYVRNEYRGQGIGKRLLERMVDEAKALGFNTCFASVSSVFRNLGDLLINDGFEPSDLKVKSCEEHSHTKQFLKSL